MRLFIVLLVSVVAWSGLSSFVSQEGPGALEESSSPEEPVALQSEEVLRILAALNAIGGFEKVTLDEEAGVLRLRGSVGSPAARRIAEEISRKVTDPLYVANGIEVIAQEITADQPEVDEGLAADEKDEALEGQLRSILSTVEPLAEVNATVKAGIVHLTGKTKDEEALGRTVELAQKMDGVLFVDNGVQMTASIPDQLRSTTGRLRDMLGDLITKLPMIAIGLVVFLFALFLARLVRRSRLVGRLFSNQPLLQALALRLVATAIVVLGALLSLDLMGATAVVGAVLGTAGIVGLAVGFAFKDIVENYLAGILLAISRPFGAKDAVKIGNYEGKVIRLSARETMLMTYDGNHLQIPNAEVFGSAVLNYSRNPRRRFDFVVGVGNDEDLSHSQHLAVQALVDMEGVMEDPGPNVRLDGFADYSMTLHMYGWVDQSQYDFGKVKSEAVRSVKRVLDEAGVEMPNPISQVLMQRVAPKIQAPKAKESAVPAHDLEVSKEIEEQIDQEVQEGEDLLEQGS